VSNPYPRDWAAQKICEDMADLHNDLEEVMAGVEIVRRLAEGADTTPCLQLVEGAAERVRESIQALWGAVRQMDGETKALASTRKQKP
jgi:hypothetical protein